MLLKFTESASRSRSKAREPDLARKISESDLSARGTRFGRLFQISPLSTVRTMAGPQPLTSDDIQAKLDAFDSVPLFMKSLPDEDSADNATLAALQNLAHEGTPDGKE